MPSPSGQIINNVSVYLTDTFWVVPLVRDSIGVWVEVTPVFQAPSGNSEELAKAIHAARDASESVHKPSPWNGDDGRVWSKASKLWDIRWYNDQMIRVVPSKNLPLRIDDPTVEIVDDEWQAVPSQATTLHPPETSDLDISETILSTLL
jgi:hypothetical protein